MRYGSRLCIFLHACSYLSWLLIFVVGAEVNSLTDLTLVDFNLNHSLPVKGGSPLYAVFCLRVLSCYVVVFNIKLYIDYLSYYTRCYLCSAYAVCVCGCLPDIDVIVI